MSVKNERGVFNQRPVAVRSRWVEIDPIEGKIPKAPACYVLIFDESKTYVGSTTNLKKRLLNHGVDYARYSHCIKTENWGYFKTVRMKYKPSVRHGDWLMTEARLIKRLKPNLNVNGVRRRSVGCHV
jgi:excinuclease UvrABC nuclease subunit